jgi:hypothetical protein
VIPVVTAAEAGNYSVVASNTAGSVSSVAATLEVIAATTVGQSSGASSGPTTIAPPSTAGTTAAAPGSRLVNLSLRAEAGATGGSLIVGFVVRGPAPKPILIRGVGPSLRTFGVGGALADPGLALYAGPVVRAFNDDWMSAGNAAHIAATSARVGAFSLAENTADAALVATLAAGAYTAELRSQDATAGIALIEVYDAGPAGETQLVNLAVRTRLGGSTDHATIGFVIAGSSSQRVLIRAVGPSLAAFGVADAIAALQLEVFRGSTLLHRSERWNGASSLRAAFDQVGAFHFSDAGSHDAALLVTLEPGAYTAVIAGAPGATGTGLAELYVAP